MLKQKLLVFICLVALGCHPSNGISFKKCKNISDNFLITYQGWKGCNQSISYLRNFLSTHNINYETRKFSKSIVPEAAIRHLPKQPPAVSIIIIYGPLVNRKKRKENYVAFIAENGNVIAILPRYSYY